MRTRDQDLRHHAAGRRARGRGGRRRRDRPGVLSAEPALPVGASARVEIRDALPPFVQTVALFVNPDAAQVAQVHRPRAGRGMLQFHGEETPEFCAQFGLPYVKACG